MFQSFYFHITEHKQRHGVSVKAAGPASRQDAYAMERFCLSSRIRYRLYWFNWFLLVWL